MLQRWVELVLKLPSPYRLPPSAGACGVTSLDHELLDDSVEYVTVVVAIGAVHTEVLHSFGTSAAD